MIVERIAFGVGSKVIWMEVVRRGRGYHFSTRYGTILSVTSVHCAIRLRNGRCTWIMNDLLRPANLKSPVNDVFDGICSGVKGVRALIGYPAAIGHQHQEAA